MIQSAPPAGRPRPVEGLAATEQPRAGGPPWPISSPLARLRTLLRSGYGIERLSRRILADPEATREALPAALGVLVSALARYARRRRGARDLLRTIAQNCDGRLPNCVSCFPVAWATVPEPPILREVLGDLLAPIEHGLSRTTALDVRAMHLLLSALTPLILGELGRLLRRRGFDRRGLSSLLREEASRLEYDIPPEVYLAMSQRDRERPVLELLIQAIRRRYALRVDLED